MKKFSWKIDDVDDNGRTPLYLAVQRNNLFAVKSSILHGACVDIPDNHGIFPITLTSNKEIIDILKTKSNPEGKNIF